MLRKWSHVRRFRVEGSSIPENNYHSGNLANRMAERAVDVIKLLMQQGQMLENQRWIDADYWPNLITEEMGHKVRRVSESDVLKAACDEGSKLTTMEQVFLARRSLPFHGFMLTTGKTSAAGCLPAKPIIVSGEAGWHHPQHIGAYSRLKQSGQEDHFSSIYSGPRGVLPPCVLAWPNSTLISSFWVGRG